jgi:hypothetical protein
MGCITAAFGVILPRFALLTAWYNDPDYWNNLLGSQVWLGLGFLLLPWTTLIYGFTSANGMSLINIIFLVFAFLGDIGTYGIGFFGTRKQTSNFRDA